MEKVIEQKDAWFQKEEGWPQPSTFLLLKE